MRICSLVPGATEVVASLGLADHLVGISHECDFPSSIRNVPVLVESVLGDEPMENAEIDHRVKTLVAGGQPLYRFKEEPFLQAQPEVVLAQDLCHVCAVTSDSLQHAIGKLSIRPRLLTLNPASLTDVFNDVERIAEVLGVREKGRDIAYSLRQRIAAVRARSATVRVKPRVLCLEWLSPLYAGGHWIPEMVTIAGGHDVLGRATEPSRVVTWDEIHAAHPDIVVLMPCGFSVARTVSELASLIRTTAKWSQALGSWTKVYAVDAGSYFSRPGPRLVDGVELMADLFDGSGSSRFGDSMVKEISGTSSLTAPTR